MDPESEEILELGTREHPFKSLMVLFVEIFEFCNFEEFELDIFVKENSNLEVLMDKIYILRVKQVNLQIYTDDSAFFRNANITVTNGKDLSFNPTTRFTLLSDLEVNITKKLNTLNFSDREKTDLLFENGVFIIDSSGFKMKNFNILSIVSDPKTAPTLIRPIYMLENQIDIEDAKIEGTGSILYSRDHLNFRASNVEIDYYQMEKGFIFDLA